MIERRKLRLMFLCGAALFSCVGCFEPKAPKPTVKALSDSPDGKYRCVVKEQPPAKGYYSPHIYTFTIIDIATARDLNGEQLKDDTDSVSLPDLKIEWAGNEVKVSSADPPGYVFAAKINNNEQQWTLVKKQEMLKERIHALGEESFGTMSLGKGSAAPSENTEYVVSQKDAAVPLLVDVLNDDDALKTEKGLVKVAYAAYCLSRINSDKGKDAAARLAAKLQAKSKGRSFEEDFALGEILKYLEKENSKSGEAKEVARLG